MFKFLKDRREAWLFWGTWTAFALLLVVKIKVDVPDAMKDWPRLISALQSDAFEDIVGDLLTGFIAAYFFYVLIDLLPRLKREKSAMYTLNLIIASVVDAYENQRTFGHEDLISLNDIKVLEVGNLRKHRAHLKSFSKKEFTLRDYYKLRCGLACMDSRISEFRAVLPLATTLTPEHVLQWLQLTDRARLFHEEYSSAPDGLVSTLQPSNAFGEPPEGMTKDDPAYIAYKKGMRLYALTLAQRMIQFLLEVEAWVLLPDKPKDEVPVNEPGTASAA